MPNLLLYTTQDKKVKVELYGLGESVYLNQDSIAKFVDTLRADSVIRKIRTTANDDNSHKGVQ